MKTPAVCSSLVQNRPRWSRLVVALGAMALGLGTASAQTQYGISLLAGQSASTGSQDGVGGAARFFTPQAVAADAAGNLYVADANNHTIRKIVVSSATVTTLAGLPGNAGSANGTGGSGGTARFNTPLGVAVNAAGTLVYVADTGNHTIRVIDLTGGTPAVTTLAGTAGSPGNVNNTGAAALFNFPVGIALSGANLYVADSTNHSIRKVVVGTGVVTTHAGPVGPATGTSGYTDSNTPGDARFSNPTGVAADNTTIYVTDKGNQRIRAISISTGAVSTFAGSGTAGSLDATGVLASFNGPSGIAIDSTGISLGTVLFVADATNHTIRRIVISTTAVTTVAGSAGSSGPLDGLGTAARFTAPQGVALDAAGSLFVADTGNQLIRRGQAASAPTFTSLANATFAVGTPSSFSVTAGGSPASTFSIIGGASLPSGVTLTSGGLLSGTPSTALGSPYIFTIQANNGVGSATQTFTLTVNHPPVITSANNTTFVVASPGTFQVVATGSPAPTFSIISGSLPAFVAQFDGLTGLLTSSSPSSTAGSPYTITIRASNTAGFVDQVFTLNLTSGPSIVTPPSSQIVGPGQTAQFMTVANANGGGTLTYQWQRQVAGTVGFFPIFDGGKYFGTTTASLSVIGTAQSDSGDQFRVVVSSGIGSPATSVGATLTVTQPPIITSLNTAIFVENQFGSFTVMATGSPSTMTYSHIGNLPLGLTLDPTTGVISGTPVTGTSSTPTYNVQVTASNGVNPPASQLLAITVSPTALLPAFTLQPVSATISVGQTASFTVELTGNPTPTIVWQRLAVGTGIFVDLVNDATFSGVNTTTLTVTNPTSGMSGDVFRAVATNTSGSMQSSSVSLTVVVGATITTFAGQANLPGSTDAVGVAARFNGPTAVALDAAGNLYVADTSNHVIRKITSGGVVSTLAGMAGASGSVDGTGVAARFNAPAGVAVSSVGTVYVADTYNHTIRVISPDGHVTTLAGLAGNTGAVDGVGSAARFLYPYGIAVDASGTLFVADTFNHTIRRIQSGGLVSTHAGLAGARGSSNGLGANARFNYPFALAADTSGNLYVADSFNHAIRRIDVSSNVFTLAGSGSSGSVDGTGVSAQFYQPSGVAVDASGNVYVADTYNSTIRRVTLGGVTSTLAGAVTVTGSTDGIGGDARFNQPFGIAVDAAGNLYVADTRNHTIRRSGSVSAPVISTQPQSRVAAVGGTATFTVTATGTPTPSVFSWYRQAAGTFGFFPLLADDATYSGVRTATLTVSNVTAAMAGDQFQVEVSNFISPNAVSAPATLSLGTAPVFTSAGNATFQATFAGSFTVTATSNPAPTYSASGLPSWATLDGTTGVISGTPPDTSGSPFVVTITASNGIPATQNLTITVDPAVIAPTITAQPQGVAVDRNGSVSLSATVSGTAPLSYQWARNGIPLAGATGAALALSNVQPAQAGNYSVTVSNSAGSVTSSAARLIVNTAPVIVLQPQPQTVAAGSVVTFSVNVEGGSAFNYQWRKNGLQIAGANNPTFTLTGVTVFDGGFYDVLVSNGLGLVGSSVATLTVVTSPTAPVISAHPTNRTVIVGTSTTLTVGASGAPAPSYQWRKNGVNIAGATTASYTVAGASPGDGGNFDVVVSNSAGNVLSRTAAVRVLARSYAGTYFGAFSGGLGNFAMHVREDNTGVFLGYLPGSSAPVMNLSFTVTDNGAFTFTQNAIASAGEVSAVAGEPARAAALGLVSVSGTIGTDGSLSGSIGGGASASLSGSRAADLGATSGVAGFYQAGAGSSAAVSYYIAGPNSQSFAIVQSGNTIDGGAGSVTAVGAVNVLTSRSVISANIAPANGTVTGNSTGAVAASFSGGSEAVLERQRLVNISSRARVGSADAVAIAGFVISGETSKPVLIRAVGPTLGSAFGVTGALASPRLELFRGQTSLAVNSGIAADRAAIDAASTQAGAFTLGSSGADAAILTTLAPGAYTAVVSSTTNTAGVALVEVYDLSGAAPGQKLLNIATRASAGAAEATLIAGFVVPPGAAKRVLIRGVGPGLSPFGVSGVLAQPTLQLLNGSNVVAQNTNWATSADRDAIAASSAQVGAFGLAANDSALIATLAPGNYTAQVTGAGAATGVALIEVYELP
jgi:sugar lactone lactonase YvrE